MIASRMLTSYYFAYFLLVLPIVGRIEKHQEPASIEAAIASRKAELDATHG